MLQINYDIGVQRGTIKIVPECKMPKFEPQNDHILNIHDDDCKCVRNIFINPMDKNKYTFKE